MKADDYAALGVKIDELLEDRPWSEVLPLLKGLGPQPATVARRLQDLWRVARFAHPPLVGPSAKAQAAIPKQTIWVPRYSIIVDGEPVGAQRPRVFGAGGIAVDIPSLLYRRAIQVQAWKHGMKPIPCDGWTICIHIQAFMPCPWQKPDIDNIAKNVLDALDSDGYFRDQRVTCLKVDKIPAQSHSLTVDVAW
jgi:Holliday junction resolvase RusA-like endonuclease